MRLLISLVCLTTCTFMSSAFALQCDSPNGDQEVAGCLGVELIDSDKKINDIYKALMATKSEEQRNDLRIAQRAWLKKRDVECNLDSKEHNRDKWLSIILQDYAKTTCVVRFTRGRISELEHMQSGVVAPKQKPEQPAEASGNKQLPGNPTAYDGRKATFHSNGKWYFEVTINPEEIVKIAPMVLSIGVSNVDSFSGTIFNIRQRDSVADSVRIGIAADLDNGKLYISRNGVWSNGVPGSNQGLDLKLGKDYAGVLNMSADSSFPYFFRKAVIPNFGGDTPMAYALPDGYSPWRNQKLN
jgi:uncharacterized protein YecT (DUF1311 family)